MYRLEDTIAAVASPPGGAARGIVRISGPNVLQCLQRTFVRADRLPLAPPAHPTAMTGWLTIPGWHSAPPCYLYLWPDGRSYTGQQAAELHTLGSPPLLEAVLRTLCAAGARPAGPGEFTLRAFLAGRIDLTQAEAVLGVVDAADRRQLEVALRQLAGGLAGPLQHLRQVLLDLLAQLEASLDFAEEDIELISPGQLQRDLAAAAEQIESIERQMNSRAQTGGAVRAVLTGRPNAGKSSLFNALVGRSAAIVSAQPGTTRDYLIAELTLDGLQCQLVDTAGWMDLPEHTGGCGAIQPADDADRLTVAHYGETAGCAAPTLSLPDFREVEHHGRPAGCAAGQSPPDIQQAAQRQTAEQLQSADVRVLCIDASQPLDQSVGQQLARAAQGNCVVVLTKIDLASSLPAIDNAVATSTVTGYGLDELRGALREAALRAVQTEAEVVSSTAVRCRHALRVAQECVCRAGKLVGEPGGEELIAAELREAIDQLGTVVGAVYTEDLLDRIFSRFCIGK
jgi:tRNA modification GTPase